MNLHLFIPSLFWSDITFPQVYHDLSLPSLEALLSKSQATTSPASDTNAWLCQAFDIKKQLDWPVAPITLQTDSIDHEVKTTKDYWLRADPVHLRIEQNHIMLADNYTFELTREEANQFTGVINQHLADDDITLLPLHSHRWYIRLTTAPKLHTHTLNSATCKNINNLLPTGEDSVKWHKLFNEIQMLLYEHPLNLVRAARNKIAINSIWFWGGGYPPQSIRSTYSHLWSNEAFSQSLANISNTLSNPLPENTGNWLKDNDEGNHIIILDSLLNKDQYNLSYEWRENLKELENTWFLPLFNALKNNQINELRISTTNENFSCDFVIKRNSLWKFWTTIKPLHFYAVSQ
ncbi:MAG: phosphoglycerate mutase [Burkholderiales bacterium]|nr:phosphoglycerate mutase [Nitrosomonas sp.]MCP5273904.1 phosphoglycerate mutase [Burkholderiales bacterium]